MLPRVARDDVLAGSDQTLERSIERGFESSTVATELEAAVVTPSKRPTRERQYIIHVDSFATRLGSYV